LLESDAALSPPRREKLVLFAVALAARLAALEGLGVHRWRFGDATAYVRAARALWRTGSYPPYTDLFLFRPPGYPAFLALSTWGHPEWIVFDRVANAVLGSAAVLVLASLGGRIFHSRRAGLVAGGLAALDPAFLLFSADVQSEPLFLLLGLASMFLLLVAVDRPSSGCGLLSGMALALAALTRPSALVLAPLLSAPLFDRRFPPPIRRVLAGSALFGFCVVLAPWTIRNAIRYRAWIPSSDGNGLVFYQGHSDWVVVVSAAWYASLALFALRGFGGARRRGVRFVAIAVLVLSLLVHVATLVSFRYRAVYWDPALILYAGAGISRVVAHGGPA